MLKYPKRVFITVLIYMALFIALVEISVRVGFLPDLTRLPQPKIVSDPYLGQRFEPNQPELDSNGWRNVTVPDHADIVSIGDSQTWGGSAPRSLAYPQQLSRLTGKTVYNLSMGGYGPVEYAYLLEKALAFRPKIVTIGLYFGNDFVECYWASERDPWHYLQRPDFDYQSHLFNPPEFKYTDVLKSIEAGTLGLSTGQATDHSQLASNLNKSQSVGSNKSWQDTLQPMVFRSKAVAFFWYRFFRDWVMDDYDEFSRKDKVYKRFEKMYGYQQAVVSYEDEHIYVQMAPYTRTIVQDMGNPVVTEGFRICLRSLKTIHTMCQDNGLLCIYVLIPTKELVYAPYLEKHGYEIKGYYADLIEFENANRAAIIAWLDSLDARYVDVLRPMQSAALKAAKDGRLLYPHSAGGHPIGAGYRIIAESVAEAIKKHTR